MRGRKSRRTTPWDDEEERTPMQEFLYQNYKKRYENHHPELTETGETALINSFVRSECPWCSSGNIRMYGHTRNGIQRYRCNDCNQTFTPVTRTIFDGHKVSVSEWIDYTLNIFRYVSINADSWNNRNAFTTSRYWLEKLFLLLEEYRKDLVFEGETWLDEAFYPVRSDEVITHEDGKKLRGLSVNQMCIGVLCDAGRILCVFEGYGKPSQKKTWEAFENHIKPGSILIHDKENAHRKLVSDLRLDSCVYDSREIKTLSGKDNPLYRVNRVHALLKLFLDTHSSFDRKEIQGYLNLFTFVMNPPADNLEKVELLLNLAFNTSKSLRYRDFFGSD